MTGLDNPPQQNLTGDPADRRLPAPPAPRFGDDPIDAPPDGDGARERSGILAQTAVIEQAKGALMLSYGVSSHQALSVLVRWAHEADTALYTMAETLLEAIIGRSDQTDPHDADQSGWLEDRPRRVPTIPDPRSGGHTSQG